MVIYYALVTPKYSMESLDFCYPSLSGVYLKISSAHFWYFNRSNFFHPNFQNINDCKKRNLTFLDNILYFSKDNHITISGNSCSFQPANKNPVGYYTLIDITISIATFVLFKKKSEKKILIFK